MIHIYYDEVSGCVSRKMITFPPGSRDACQALPAVGQLWPSDNDDGDYGDDNKSLNNGNNDDDDNDVSIQSANAVNDRQI